ncbi:putative encoded by [Lyophyllum shimeji]|uniref:Encoded by n=1 Tax=Lyophyllum shimeji TaxID=47721 RepID=A0A9P3USR2_LYOSH|nr:putative encoded by [Lyophyllum shimeji]
MSRESGIRRWGNEESGGMSTEAGGRSTEAGGGSAESGGGSAEWDPEGKGRERDVPLHLQQRLLRAERTVLIEIETGDTTAPADRSTAGNHAIREALNKKLVELDKDDFLFEGGLVAEDGELPDDARTRIRGITSLKSGAYLLEVDSAGGATRFRTYARSSAPQLLGPILGRSAAVKEKAHNLIFRFVPCSGMFDPSNRDHLDEIEQDNNLSEGAIVSASWLKRADRRSPKQTVASLKVVCSTAGDANHLLQSRVFIAGHLVAIRKDVREPIRCNKCQHYGHICSACKNEERCASCASSDHSTAECSASFTPHCPIFKKLCDNLDHRFPKNNMPFFPTGDAWTWASASPKRASTPLAQPAAPSRGPSTQLQPMTDAPPRQMDADSDDNEVPPPPPPPQRRQGTLDDFGYAAATDAYTLLDVPSPDITAVCFNSDFGHLSIFNIYNDCSHNDSLTVLSAFLSSSLRLVRPSFRDHMLWLGDFNRHHPMWESVDNRHLNSSVDDIRPLLDLLWDYDMELALPPGLPTLQTSRGNWTRPDNVWCAHCDLDPIIQCDVVPSLRPVMTDHLPVITEVELPLARTSFPPSKNFPAADWEAFSDALKEKLSLHPPACRIASKEEFDAKVNLLTSIIQEVIADDRIVPMRKPCPFSKCWWNAELTQLKSLWSRASNEAHKFRYIHDHPAHAELARMTCVMADKIRQSKLDHWIDWLENINARQIYTANKYVVSEPTDFSCDRIPDLKTRVNGVDKIATTNVEKAEALAESFFPPPPPAPPPAPVTEYPDPLPGIKFFPRARIRQAISQLKPYKAPGPDGIPNVVLKRCADVLIDHLFFIFRAVFELDVYHDSWLVSTTLVLRKPGKPAYDVAKAYRPIGLLNTIGKLLSTLVAADLSHLAEKHNMLSPGRFGGRPGRNTSDAMHMVTHKIKDAWRSGNVAAALFLDVQGAFPNTVWDRLLHNMRECGVPECYINLTRRMLTGRRTRLKFDDFVSELMDIMNGTTQGCPLAMLFYAFYNAPLIRTAIATRKSESSFGFVDDSMLLAIAKTLVEAHEILRDMVERRGGAFDWSISHNSPFELSKLALMNYPRSFLDVIPPPLVLTRRNPDGSTTRQTVATVSTYKYLGVMFDSKLRWSAHLQKVAVSASWWSLQVAHLSRISGGMPPHRIRQLYNTVAVPAFTYAADIWYTGVHSSLRGQKRLGSVAITNKLTSVQRRAAKLVTGSLSTAAGDVLDAHSNLLPVDLLYHKVLFRAAARLASLPPTHPLHGPIRKAARRHVKRHRSPLHNLFFVTGVDPASVEVIAPTRCRPNYVPSFSTHILDNKIAALAEANRAHRRAPVSVYCDGSGFEGGISASAVLYVCGTEEASLQYFLGPMSRHTVYEAEIVGLTLGLHLLTTFSRRLRSLTVIGSDSQAVIKALCNQRPHPAHYLLDHVYDAAEKLHVKQDRIARATARRAAINSGSEWTDRTRRVIDLQVHWTPGHVDFAPNERADEIAKEAARGASSPPNLLPPYLQRKPLPASIPALRQEHLTALRKTWRQRWERSPRFARINAIDPSLPSKKFLKLVEHLDRRRSALIAQLRTGHIPLNQHLFRIRRAESP